MHSVIELLQNNHLIWQGIDQKSNIDTISTGYTELDKQLGGGFPVHGVIEISSECGIGELRLLTHYIKNNKQRLSLFINPPGNLCSEFLAQQGINLLRLYCSSLKRNKKLSGQLNRDLKVVVALAFYYGIHHWKYIKLGGYKWQVKQVIACIFSFEPNKAIESTCLFRSVCGYTLTPKE